MILLVRTIINNNGKLARNEIINSLENQFKAYDDIKSLRIDEYPISTFDKDKKEIRDAWKIDLECENEKYSINTNFEGAFQNDLLNSFVFLSSLNSDLLLPAYVLPETRKNTGLQYFAEISDAIESKNQLKIKYFDYISETEKEKVINPYLLKQKDYKWYVLASDESKYPFKSYALERIRSIEKFGKFKAQKIDFETPYKDALGMFTNEEPTKVVLEFDHRDGHYLKANPIHSSQKIIYENDEIIQFEFFIKPNEDFIMEIMKRTWSVKIIEPNSLRENCVALWEKALELNKKLIN